MQELNSESRSCKKTFVTCASLTKTSKRWRENNWAKTSLNAISIGIARDLQNYIRTEKKFIRGNGIRLSKYIVSKDMETLTNLVCFINKYTEI